MIEDSKEIPKDILVKLMNDYKSENDYNEALVIINTVRQDVLNIGWIQLSRAIIIIADGDINKMKNIIESDYYGDPRDVVMKMMRIPGSTNDHGMTPFGTS